ncbi:MAG: hypothetical protein ACR2PM_19235 [Hyphomicrobiales bacterium]
MTFSPPDAALWRRIFVLAVIVVTMTACRTTGDFGRVKPSYYYDTLVPKMQHTFRKHKVAHRSTYPLTEDEEEMRARSFTIINNGRLPAMVQDQGFQRERRVDHSTGSADLYDHPYPREPDVLLAVIDEDLKLVRPFERVAVRVQKTDKRRLRDLRQGGDVPAQHVLNATARVEENRSVVDRTLLTLHNRIDDYEVEMRRSLLKYPGPHKHKLKNAIGRLAQRVRKLEMRMRRLSDPNGVDHYSDLMG